MPEKNIKEEVLLAFSHDAFAKKCCQGLVDDEDFYKNIEENEKRELRSLKKSLTFVVF